MQCSYCQRECKNERSLRNHERLCKLNPDFSQNTEFWKFLKGSHSSSKPWNKGLTKATDKRLLKDSERKKGKKIGGCTSHTIEAREKISKARSQYIEEKGAGGFLDIPWYGILNIEGKEYKVRGSWELKYAQWLNTNGILWNRDVNFKYQRADGVKRTYIPDFYLPATKEYKEVKGYFSTKDQEKLHLVETQNNVKIDLLFKQDLEKLGIIL